MRMSKTDDSGLGDVVWSLSVPKPTPARKGASVEDLGLRTGVGDATCEGTAPESPTGTGGGHGGVLPGDERSPPIRPGTGTGAFEDILSRSLKVLEKYVKQYPDQWFVFEPIWQDGRA